MTLFEDADLTHPWVERYRIPLIKHEWPRWRYEVALVVPTDDEIGQRLSGATWPTEDEAAVIADLIEFRMTYYREGWKAKMRERALDVDDTTNTVILVKRSNGWAYKRESWQHGSKPFRSEHNPYTPDIDGLRALLDHIDPYGGMKWSEWKAKKKSTAAR